MIQFDKLTLDEKAEMLWNKGKHLATGEYYNQKINLYTIEGKLYEVWCDVVGNKITDIKEMKDGRIFKKYFQQN